MQSFLIRKNHETFFLNGIKLVVLKTTQGKIRLQIHEPPGSQMCRRDGDQKFYWRAPPKFTADELRALAGV